MADSETCSGVKILKNSKIVVNVEEALQDILVVTYSLENKLFQGVLLDSTKRHLPCGISTPTHMFSQNTSPKPDAAEEDKFYSVSQRFTYFQEKTNPNAANGGLLPHFHFRRAIKQPPKFKSARMTVRLRPRQVLCSKCRSICNENSENVDHSKKTKNPPQPFSENRQDNQSKETSEICPTLIPKLNRLRPNEISNAVNGKIVNNPQLKLVDRDYWIRPPTPPPLPPLPLSSLPPPQPPPPLLSTTTPLQLETGGPRVYVVDDEGNDGDDDDEYDDKEEYTREDDGEGKMVLRKKRSVGSMEDLWDESVFEEATKKARTTPVIKISFGSQGEGTVLKIPSRVQNYSESEPEEKHKTASVKAAKRALKKAKKEARRKLSGETSPGASPAYEALHYRRHRHKMKHKKKHKEDRNRNAADYTDMKERCLRQKLSISLRRLNATAYAHRNDSGSSPASSHSSEEACPDFPPLTVPLESEVSSAHTSDGHLLAVGDIVWGKIHGFPWWPGKVLSISMKNEKESPQAHVAWYGSSTSSLMSCDQLSPFLETFKSRYNKRKKSGPYKEAIRQATSEASESQHVTMPLSITKSLTNITSPTQVHVLS